MTAMTVPESRRLMPSITPRTASIDGRLSAARATPMSISPTAKAESWSSRLSASRSPPRATSARRSSTAGSIRMPSDSATRASCSRVCWYGMRRKSKRWQRDTIVGGTFWASVVASTNSACGGGSSSVFRNASHASGLSRCASSMM